MRSVLDSPDPVPEGDAVGGEGDLGDQGDIGEAAARRMVLLALAAFIAFVLAAGVAVALSRSDDDSADDPSTISPAAALVGTGTGPLAGTDVATYSEGRRRALEEARGRWVAVVSLREYATEAKFKSAFTSVHPDALLVAPAGGEPEVVDGSLTAWAARAKTDAEEERRQLQSMFDTTDDKAFKDQFQADIDRLGKLLAGLDPGKPVVFGFVATGSVSDLRALASRPDVRLVDIVARRPSGLARLRGLRPEETVR
ncbi:MAG: hypothetical protein QOI20_2569, partial [Acidimicrobiaceae bacterium]|nr:hypothetical protein [Acidimicrobiaceae bacterium]